MVMTKQTLDFIETIMDLLNQSCYIETKDNTCVIDHQCTSAFEHAVFLLEDLR